jgi:pimeloyl-ACP methyl ester carboxylesterase
VRQMKDRAATVGAAGLAPIVGQLLSAGKKGGVRLHLLGHSYGTKVVLSAALHAPQPASKIASMLLLQPAISCYSFARDVLGLGFDGGYRPVPGRVERPVVATFSAEDRPLSLFFHLAVRRAEDLGDQRTAGAPPSRFAALGGYGPQGVEQEVQIVELREFLSGKAREILAHPVLRPSTRIVGVNGTGLITSHGDVRNAAVQALLCAAAA